MGRKEDLDQNIRSGAPSPSRGALLLLAQAIVNLVIVPLAVGYLTREWPQSPPRIAALLTALVFFVGISHWITLALSRMQLPRRLMAGWLIVCALGLVLTVLLKRRYFQVYADFNSPKNHFAPTGFMGDVQQISFTPDLAKEVHSGSTAIELRYDPQPGGQGWAGVIWQEPGNNWANRPGGYNLSGLRYVTFWAKGEGQQSAHFCVGGVGYMPGTCTRVGEFPDSICPGVDVSCNITDGWLHYAIAIPSTNDLSHVITGFGWVAGSAQALLLDDIAWEASPGDALLCSPAPPVALVPIGTPVPPATPTTTANPTTTPTSIPSPTPSPTCTATPTSTPSATPSPAPKVEVRDGPSTLFGTVGAIQRDQVVETVAKYTNCMGNLWYKIRLPDGRKGWVLAAFVTPDISPDLVPIECPFAATTDEETLRGLIDAEGRAVIEEDLGIICLVFARGATIVNVAENRAFTDPIQRYQEKFANEKHFRVDHGHFTLQSISASRAFATTSSSGQWMWKKDLTARPSPTPFAYDLPPNADEWTFGKDINGCWVITRLEFNAHTK